MKILLRFLASPDAWRLGGILSASGVFINQLFTQVRAFFETPNAASPHHWRCLCGIVHVTGYYPAVPPSLRLD
jgi:hypothetical protein